WPAAASPGLAATSATAGAAAGAAALAEAAGAGASWATRAVVDSASARARADPSTAGRKPAGRKLIHLTPERLANTADGTPKRSGGQKPQNYPVPSYLGQTAPMPNPLQGAQFLLAAHRLSQLPADEG